MQTKCCSFLILCCSLKFLKLTPALFVNDFCSPKVMTPLKLRPPKAANSESKEGRYYRNSTVIQVIDLFEVTQGTGASSKF